MLALRLGVSPAIDDIFLSTRTDTNVRKKRREINMAPFCFLVAREKRARVLIRSSDKSPPLLRRNVKIEREISTGVNLRVAHVCIPRDWGYYSVVQAQDNWLIFIISIDTRRRNFHWECSS